ncbi:MAG: hypothetical protein SFX73_07830 [Kofleriaceae bacterium]|nr:hypothetical protein [Kofleriaceae bacterium]
MSSPRSLSLVALALAVAVLVGHARVLLGGQTWDDVRYHTEVAPPRMAAATAILHGELPAWWEGTMLGVPLAAEPSHGALYPPLWIGPTPRTLDVVMLLHLLWSALGVAVWARSRAIGARNMASDQGALVAGVLVATTGLLASTALRGVLPALAQLPWIAVTAGSLALADDARARARATLALAGLVGLVALTGVFGALIDALVLALALGARRKTAAYLALALGAGLAIGAIQWVPALLQLGEGAGSTLTALPLSRLLELIVPGSFGASDPARAIHALAGATPWAPSLFVGAPLLAFAAVRIPGRRVYAVLGALGVLVVVAGRGAWPAWLGAPELHLGALVLVLAAHAGAGVDSFTTGKRRAVLAVGAAAALSAIALGALWMQRGAHSAERPAIDRALVDGGLGLVCCIAILVLVWRRPGRNMPLVLALIVLPGVGSMPSVTPTIERAIVTEAPKFVTLLEDAPRPLRAFRPVRRPDEPDTVLEAVSTFGGSSAWRWGITGARSEDPARPVDHDRTWRAASNEGGALLDRFGIHIAILPATMISPQMPSPLATRGDKALFPMPVTPIASVMRSWRWSIATEDALDNMFSLGGGSNVLRGTVMLKGTGPVSPGTTRDVEPCSIERWDAGDIALACTASAPGYAVVSSTTSPGWSVTVDGEAAPWLTADVLRRAVAVSPGAHRIHWTYSIPGLPIGLLIAAAGVLALGVLVLRARSTRPPEDARVN